MRYAQKDVDLAAYPVMVQVTLRHPPQLANVPVVEDVVPVPLDTVVFSCVGQMIPPVPNATDDTVFRVERRDPPAPPPHSLVVQQYPVEPHDTALPGGEPGASRTV